MYLVRMSIYKEKPPDDRQSAVEIPAFFRYESSMEAVRKYVDKTYRDIAFLYIEYIEDLDEDVEVIV